MGCDLNHRLAISEASVGRPFTGTMSVTDACVREGVDDRKFVGKWRSCKAMRNSGEAAL